MEGRRQHNRTRSPGCLNVKEKVCKGKAGNSGNATPVADDSNFAFLDNSQTNKFGAVDQQSARELERYYSVGQYLSVKPMGDFAGKNTVWEAVRISGAPQWVPTKDPAFQIAVWKEIVSLPLIPPFAQTSEGIPIVDIVSANPDVVILRKIIETRQTEELSANLTQIVKRGRFYPTAKLLYTQDLGKSLLSDYGKRAYIWDKR